MFPDQNMWIMTLKPSRAPSTASSAVRGGLCSKKVAPSDEQAQQCAQRATSKVNNPSRLLAALGYTGPLELLTCHLCCILGPGVRRLG